jgi:hypothetical protein
MRHPHALKKFVSRGTNEIQSIERAILPTNRDGVSSTPRPADRDYSRVVRTGSEAIAGEIVNLQLQRPTPQRNVVRRISVNAGGYGLNAPTIRPIDSS